MRPLFLAAALLLSACDNDVPILCYHWVGSGSELAWDATPERFYEQLDELAAHGFTTLTLSELFDYREGKRSLPPRPVVLTFDDGDRTMYDTVFPALKARGQRAELFLVEGFLRDRSEDRYHWKRGSHSLPMLLWSEVSEMVASGVVVPESHSVSHVRLRDVHHEHARQEIARSRERLSFRLQAPISFFAYPGHAHDAKLMGLVEEAGYRGAVAGANRLGVRYDLFRLSVFRHHNLEDFRKLLGRNWADAYMAPFHDED